MIVYGNDSVSFSTGYNTLNGYVAKWTGITAGADGSFSIKSEWDTTQAGTKGYAMSAFRLEEETGEPPTQYTGYPQIRLAMAPLTLDPAGGLYNENTTVSLTANADPGWEFSGWSGDLSGSAQPRIDLHGRQQGSVTATFVEETPSTAVCEDFETGYTLGAELRTHPDWFYEDRLFRPSSPPRESV